MRMIVINLVRATERRQKMADQFAAFGLTAEFLDATDGRNLTDADRARVDHNRRKAITPYPLTDNEIGCWLSHCRAMQRLIDSGDRMAVILEDDSALSPDFPKVVQAIEGMTTLFDVIDLHRNFKKSEIFIPRADLLPRYALGRIGYTHMNATAYVITRDAAQKFLSQVATFAHAVDKELHSYWKNGLNIYGLENPVAVQDDGGHSYIDETRGQDRPQERLRYPDADGIIWKLRRRLTRATDSLQKRWAFRKLLAA